MRQIVNTTFSKESTGLNINRLSKTVAHATNSEGLSKKDLVIGTVMALMMGIIFTLLSSGLSLIVTFVPGVFVTWLVYLWLYVKKTKLPDSSAFISLFFTLLAVQFIHFAEEFMMGFRIQFPFLWECYLSHLVESISALIFPWSGHGSAILDLSAVNALQIIRQAQGCIHDRHSICTCINCIIDHLCFTQRYKFLLMLQYLK